MKLTVVEADVPMQSCQSNLAVPRPSREVCCSRWQKSLSDIGNLPRIDEIEVILRERVQPPAQPKAETL